MRILRLRSIALLTILAIVFFGFSNLPRAKATGNSSLSFSPSTRSIVVGASTTLDAVVNPGSTPHQVSSVALYITYNQAKISLTNIACSSTFSTVLYGPVIPSPEDGTARIDCGIPGGSSAVTTSTTAATFSFTALAAATNSVVAFTTSSSIGADDDLGVNVFDGDITTGKAQVTVTSNDTTAPSFTINDGASSSYVQSDTINITVSDASGVASQYYGFSTDSTCNDSDTISTAFTSGTSFSITGNHSDYLCVKATDSSTNSNVGYQLVGQLHTDNTAPTFTVNDGTSSSSVQSDTINITVSDSASGVASKYYGFSTDSTCNSSDTISTTFTSGTSFSITGNHLDYLCVKATDSASNTSYQLIGQLHTDNTAPTITQTTQVTSTAYSTTPSYTFNTTEAGTISYGGDCSSTTTSASSSGSQTITFSSLAIGTHSNCTVKVTDVAGNQSSVLTVSSFAITYRADLNLDHKVDNVDYTYFHNYYNTSNSTADMNGDGTVNSTDYTYIHADYNKSF
jgi:hypothetical protein